MTKEEIIVELTRLSPRERREIAMLIFELDEEAETLAECDRLPNERFQVLDKFEEDDAKAKAKSR